MSREPGLQLAQERRRQAARCSGSLHDTVLTKARPRAVGRQILSRINPKVAARARSLRDHGQVERYYHDEVGYNYRMEAFQEAVLGIKLRRLPRWSQKRRDIATLYRERLLPRQGRSPRDP